MSSYAKLIPKETLKFSEHLMENLTIKEDRI